MMEFHVSREARDRYQFRETLFAFHGNVVFANLAASREFAHRMNEARGAARDPERTVHAGALYAMGLIDELSHALVEFYRRKLDPVVSAEALRWFEGQLGREAVDRTLLAFANEFPPIKVYRGEKTAQEWLQGQTDGVAHRDIAFEEMMLLWLANANPAFSKFNELFADKELAKATAYSEIVAGLPGFFATRPVIGPDNLTLIEMLRAPALASPDSLGGQLAFIKEKWASVLGDVLERLLLAIDVLKEEDVAIWMRFHPPSAATLQRRRGWRWDPASVAGEVPSYAESAQEYERFSPDQEWMPSTVLLAKSTYVWLEQLSRQYGWDIHRLDQIPSEELALMARRGMNALWLIGIWERSRASKTIKQLCGNQDAVASAYSIYGYTIAEDLGGEAAYRNLRDRAYAHGIRLASDMVPNHMGIDSPWVIEHPEWFMSRSDSPYPAYSFEGPDLSSDGRVEIKIEDHYYEQTDAAVVFRRRDRWTGDTRYVYHGNDGTSFPWNDTAQLDYLNPAAREQVIQTILYVARLFPIIRFDAAMTLAKRHFQRLWYPLPGTGGAIPSRAEYSLSKAAFDAAMPQEFWREVVDRVAREVPGTLLLAEAFWLMEGYFVRTLGMHRVYNSAFMNMMRDEDNAKYRSVIKNTIEFDPDILKRYVNFMSNPDERTAIDQFGNGDKCFGVATMMATLPGLPMFGHGQIEGFTEKYGMEYRKARYQEQPDQGLVQRHEREIAPLLHRRWLFAESQNFLLYDFYRLDGSVDENVFAYSNRRDDQRALVIYHNRYATTWGTIHRSAAYADKGAGQLRQQLLGEALVLPADGNTILGFHDVTTGLQHLQRATKLVSEGFSIELQAYKCHVFVDWRELRPDEQHPWDRLCDSLNGRGVPNLDDALVMFELAPVHDALIAVLSTELLQSFAELASDVDAIPGCKEPASTGAAAVFLRDLEQQSTRFFGEAGWAYSRRIRHDASLETHPVEAWSELCELVRAATHLPSLEAEFSAPWPADARVVLPSSSPRVRAIEVWAPVLAWSVIQAFAQRVDPSDPSAAALRIFDQLRLREPLARAFTQLGFHGEDSWRAAARVRLAFLGQQEGFDRTRQDSVAGVSAQFWQDPDARWLIDVHEAPGGPFFNKELHEQMLWWLQLPRLMSMAAESGTRTSAMPQSDWQAADGKTTAAVASKTSTIAPPVAVAQPGTSSRRSLERENRNLAIKSIESQLEQALTAAKQAGYRIAKLFPGATGSRPKI